MYLELLANLTATLFVNISAADILAAIDENLDPIPDPLLCIISDLRGIPYVTEETRNQLVQEINKPFPSPKFSEIKFPGFFFNKI